MPTLQNELELNRCPHCNVDNPRLSLLHRTSTSTHKGTNKRDWVFYGCSRCGGVVIAASTGGERGEAEEIYPAPQKIDDSLPDRAKRYLEQAVNSLHAPSGAVILAASAVDAMLKAHGYVKGSLYSRIDKAKEDHLITEGMAKWAHEVRLDANDERHADEEAAMPETEDARRAVDFARALGEFLFALPARIKRGIKEANPAAEVPGQPLGPDS